ncbi:MAG: hypothetical protein AB1401_00610 [Thermodesulfobacteriota bacterium]
MFCKKSDHQYAEKECPQCGQEFCYACCNGTNVDQEGNYDPDYMNCPYCGADYYGADYYTPVRDIAGQIVNGLQKSSVPHPKR